MPVGPYPTFDACVKAQRAKGKSKESARKICATIQEKSHEANKSNKGKK